MNVLFLVLMTVIHDFKLNCVVLQANIGHAVAAAGLTALVTTALVLSKQIVPPHAAIEFPIAEAMHTNGLVLPTEAPVAVAQDEPLCGSVNGTSVSSDPNMLG